MAGNKHQIMKGDRVRVIRGNDRDVEGTVLEVLRDAGRVRVEGVNLRKRHTRPSEANPDGGILTFEAAVHMSNVMLVDPATETEAEFGCVLRKMGRRSASRSKRVTPFRGLGR